MPVEVESVTLICGYCKGSREVAKRPGKPREYCSESCKSKAYRERNGVTGHEAEVRERADAKAAQEAADVAALDARVEALVAERLTDHLAAHVAAGMKAAVDDVAALLPTARRGGGTGELRGLPSTGAASMAGRRRRGGALQARVDAAFGGPPSA